MAAKDAEIARAAADLLDTARDMIRPAITRLSQVECILRQVFPKDAALHANVLAVLILMAQADDDTHTVIKSLRNR